MKAVPMDGMTVVSGGMATVSFSGPYELAEVAMMILVSAIFALSQFHGRAALLPCPLCFV